MNLDEMKKNSVNSVELVDSLNAPLLELKVALTTSSTIPAESDLKVFIDDHETDESNRKTIIYPLSKTLQYANGETDKFILEPVFKGNMVQMKAYIERRLTHSVIEQSISIGDDLSGAKLSLTLTRFMLYNAINILESSNYKIVDKTDSIDGNQIETIAIRKQDDTLVDILFQYDGTNNAVLMNTEEYVLPDDFGTVTNIYELTNLDNYMKKMTVGELEVLETPIIEELTYQPILMFSSYNKISTNYENAELSLIYPKNTDFMKYFLISSFSYSLNNEDKFLTLDDIYFKNCFTEIEKEKINAAFNKLTIKCLNSVSNNFSLDCDGNLVVNSITTKVQDESSENIDFNQIYPVGSIYLSVNSTNPSTLFGGSWEAFAAGRTLVGIDANQDEFNAVNKIGGEKKHTLRIDEMPSHDHKRPNSILYNGNSSWWIGGAGGTTIEVVETPTSTSGGNQAHNNLQPYITVYMWKRVA